MPAHKSSIAIVTQQPTYLTSVVIVIDVEVPAFFCLGLLTHGAHEPLSFQKGVELLLCDAVGTPEVLISLHQRLDFRTDREGLEI